MTGRLISRGQALGLSSCELSHRKISEGTDVEQCLLNEIRRRLKVHGIRASRGISNASDAMGFHVQIRSSNSRNRIGTSKASRTGRMQFISGPREIIPHIGGKI